MWSFWGSCVGREAGGRFERCERDVTGSDPAEDVGVGRVGRLGNIDSLELGDTGIAGLTRRFGEGHLVVFFIRILEFEGIDHSLVSRRAIVPGGRFAFGEPGREERAEVGGSFFENCFVRPKGLTGTREVNAHVVRNARDHRSCGLKL